ncbi:cytochrome P450 [Collybia nuda]|uniref:Cytochrome P450 n=1 Tax=Collybia nuda TaxID=64659 RepID=A0A9P5Y689_9AGAR|nr:cytochrome P450 [Collybia nuda]
MFMFALLLFVTIVWLKPGSKKHIPFPPGPPADPLIGHLRIIPSNNQETFFYELGKKYGDIIYLNILGRSIVVLNSARAAVDLLEKRSSNYSDRVDFPIYKLAGYTKSLVFMKYGKDFQFHRRMFQQYFSKNGCIPYRPLQACEAHVLVQNLVSQPEHKENHFLHFATALIMRITYGHRITTNDDPYLRIAESINFAASNCGPPGGTPVDVFPILRYFPSWFPGAYYAGFARSQKALVARQHEFPYTEVEKHIEKGAALPSFVAENIEMMRREGVEGPQRIQHIQGAAATIYTAGAETTSSTLSFFCLALVLHPNSQLKAQAEIDEIVGSERLPEMSDRPSLPYLECLLQETLRLMDASSTSIPHRSLADDIYNGMFIPKGSIVIANTRAITLDERVYSNPHVFNPTRFLAKPQGLGEPHPVGPFGFGRRICPGRHFADDSLWIAMATILATLSISRATDSEGGEIIPDVRVETGITSHPKPFPCDIKFRTSRWASLITQRVNSY